MYNFKIIENEPDKDNKYFIKTTHGGYSDCIPGNEKKRKFDGSTLPNCVGCATGYFNNVVAQITGVDGFRYKLLNSTPEVNLERAKKKGLKVGKEPQPASMLIWSSSNSGGHVAFVESVNKDSITIVESAWSGAYFWKRHNITNKNGNWGRKSPYKFECFIYNPYVKELKPTDPVERNTKVNQLEIKSTTLRVRNKPSLKGEVYGYAKKGYYNYYDVNESDGYKWYRIDDDQWVAYGEKYMGVYQKELIKGDRIKFIGEYCYRTSNTKIMRTKLAKGYYKVLDINKKGLHQIRVSTIQWVDLKDVVAVQ